MDSLGGFLIEALKRKAAQALADAQAQQEQQTQAQAKFAQAQAKIAEAQAQLRAQAQARQRTGGAPAPARAPAPASVPLGRPAAQAPSAPRRAPARPVEVEVREPEASLLAPFHGGRPLLSALIFSEALLPPLSLREPGPRR